MDLFAIFNTHYYLSLIDERRQVGFDGGLNSENVSPGKVRFDLKL